MFLQSFFNNLKSIISTSEQEAETIAICERDLSEGTVPATPAHTLSQTRLDELLWQASANGEQDKIRMLVVSGANVTAQDPEGRTALNIASQYGHAPAYKTLLAAREMQALKLLETSNSQAA